MVEALALLEDVDGAWVDQVWDAGFREEPVNSVEQSRTSTAPECDAECNKLHSPSAPPSSRAGRICNLLHAQWHITCRMMPSRAKSIAREEADEEHAFSASPAMPPRMQACPREVVLASWHVYQPAIMGMSCVQSDHD